MKSAYHQTWLHNLQITKTAKHWLKHDLIGEQEFSAIKSAYVSGLYHPNFLIRILLFIAATIALGGVTGMLALFVGDSGQAVLSVLCLLYGVGSFVFLDRVFIGNLRHYKSGVNEAILYHAIGFTIGGMLGLSDFNEHLGIIVCLVVFSAAAYRYIDLVSTVCALASLAYLIFFELYQVGGIFQQIIPLVFIILFTPLYFFIRKLKESLTTDPWSPCLILLESLCLLLIYAAGNYLVVRELSVSLMDLYLEEGQDIPFAYLFYGLTVIIPVAYLYFGIKNRNVVLLRVSLLVIAFSVFTFKYYYSLGHHEITFTIGGSILVLLSLYLFRFLKSPKAGFTAENILSSKWSNLQAEAFIISQTLGGNKAQADVPSQGGGGSFSGGGSTDAF